MNKMKNSILIICIFSFIFLFSCQSVDRKETSFNEEKSKAVSFYIVDSEATELFIKNSVFNEDGSIKIKAAIPEDCNVLAYYAENSPYPKEWYVIKKKASIDGTYIESVSIAEDMFGVLEVNFMFNKEGADIFRDVTSKNIGKKLAIVSNDKVIIAAVICDVIPNGNISIAGLDLEKALRIKEVLEN